MTSTPTSKPYDVVILGAGILGLATADALSTAGVRVAIIARDLPEDLDSAAFASPWAGANWSSFAASEAERRRDTITFSKLGELARTHPDLVQHTPFSYVWDTDAGYSSPWYKDLVGNFRPLEKNELPPGYTQGVRFDSFTLNPPRLLAFLAGRLRSAGVPLIRARVSSLAEASIALGAPPRILINATGLGSRALLGVADPKVHPVRGQTVLVRAPGVHTCYGVRDAKMAPGHSTYIIPRPGSGGCVILGGTVLKDQYSTLPNAKTAERILKDAHALEPRLAPGGTWRDIEVVSHNVGLRPAREGGLRLEIEQVALGDNEDLIPAAGRGAPRSQTVLHCYGIGPAGYQASFGIAAEARDMVLAHLGTAKL